MKKQFILWTVVVTVMGFMSCSKSEVLNNKEDHSVPANSRKGGQPGPTSPSSYGGYSTALNATLTVIQNGTVNSNQTLVANTGLLPATGGTLTANELTANIQGMVSAANLSAAVSGSGSQTTAQSSASSLNVTVNGNVITADNLSATANANCGGTSGNSTVTNLVVNGTPITITGAANQTVMLPGGGLVIINEQSTSKKAKTTTINVSALHILLPNAADIRVATARAEIKC